MRATETNLIDLEMEEEKEADIRKESGVDQSRSRSPSLFSSLNSSNGSSLMAMACREEKMRSKEEINKKKKQPGKGPENLCRKQPVN